VQGKTERVTELLDLLQEFYRDKLTELLSHESHARWVTPYDVNNTYQYIVNRDETHLSWIQAAIADLGGTVPAESDVQQPSAEKADWRGLAQQDLSRAQALVDRWRPRVEAMKNARHRNMLRVILGEALEQKRSFEQALNGRDDLLGKRDDAVGARVGQVLSSRWIE
jgi:hypothetical protein